jgi:PAS domain S-box-containing protein
MFYQRNGRGSPLLIAILNFLVLIGITQYIAYQSHLIVKEREKEELHRVLNEKKSHFNGILSRCIAAANTISVIYKQFREVKDFDSIAQNLIEFDESIDLINLTDKYVITHAYPLEGNQMILGRSLLDFPRFKKETEIAISNPKILFTGPYEMTNDRGMAIASRVPIIVGDTVNGFVIAVTKLPTIFRLLPQFSNKGGKFVYQLSKENPLTHKTEYFFPRYRPRDRNIASIYMPEGDWTLYVAYAKGYPSSFSTLTISVLGILLSLAVAFVVYTRSKRTIDLERQVHARTHDLNERVKELTTIYEVNEILRGEWKGTEDVLKRIAEVLPKGWQHPDICAACIKFGGRKYTTANYQDAGDKLTAHFHLQDGRQGTIEIVYLEKRFKEKEEPFIREEKHLLNALAETIQVHISKKVNQDALKLSEARFRSAFESPAVGMGLSTVRGKWLMVNDALCKMLGYSDNELRLYTFQELTHPDDSEADAKAVSQLVNGEISFYRANKRYIHKNGSTVWVNLNVALVRDEALKPLYFVAQITDITDRVESQMKFQALVEKSLVGVYIIQDGKFVYVNPKIMEESGYSEQELTRQSFDQFIYEEDLPIVRQHVTARLENREVAAHYEVRIKKKNGQLLWTEMYGTSTLFEGGHAIIGTIVNVTDRKNLELERQKIIRDLLQRNKDLKEFNYILSHNVRAPLTTILALSRFLRESQSEEERLFTLDGIEESAEKLDAIIRDLNKLLQERAD